ncbi:MAG: EamA family transporter [Weeksellaceae bacterium]|nr:EamA family transporter [Weeksellaceae bacterium]
MNSKYYLAVITTFVIYGLFSLPLKAIDKYSSLDILLYRLMMACIVILLISFVFRQKITLKNAIKFKKLPNNQRRKLLIVNIVSSVMLAVNWYLFIYVMNRVSVNATALAYMLCPIINTFLAYIFLKEKLSQLQWWAIALSSLSCALLGYGNLGETVYAFSIGLFFAIYLVLQKDNNRLDRFFVLTFQILVATLMLLPLIYFMDTTHEKSSYFFGIVLIIAVVFTIIPMFLNIFALNGLSSSTAGIFIYLNPILSFLLAIFYFKEQMSDTKIIAYSIVFFSVLMFNSKLILQLINKKTA